jgi:beta-glucosidase
LFGAQSPSGKLPVTFPLVVGQVPIYYARRNTAKPPTPGTVVHIDDIRVRAPQTSLGMTSQYLDAGYRPLYPFGFGLSYASFSYSEIQVSQRAVRIGETLTIRAFVTNTGKVPADEVAQLYVQDPVGSVTRPVRELKGFRRIRLDPGERREVEFKLDPGALAFHGRDMRLVTEPGDFRAWIGGSSEADLRADFSIVAE